VRVVVADALFVNLEDEEAGKILGETEWYVALDCHSLAGL
jgi:hypothetical protein